LCRCTVLLHTSGGLKNGYVVVQRLMPTIHRLSGNVARIAPLGDNAPYDASRIQFNLPYMHLVRTVITDIIELVRDHAADKQRFHQMRKTDQQLVRNTEEVRLLANRWPELVAGAGVLPAFHFLLQSIAGIVAVIYQSAELQPLQVLRCAVRAFVLFDGVELNVKH